jgi:hypothetical protein
MQHLRLVPLAVTSGGGGVKVPAGSLLGAALSYARAGWAVFPCWPDKRPMTAHGFHDATTDEQRIVAFWTKRPEAWVGMPVPNGYVVVDVDDFGAFEEMESRGMDLPTTLTAATPRGQHYWYRTQRNVAPATGFIPHVDLRGPGSYVIVPPSPGYRWLIVPGGIPYGMG